MKWKLVCALPWLLLLGLILSIDFQALEGTGVILLTLVLNIAAAPISFAVIGIIWLIRETLGDFSMGAHLRLQDFSMITALIWWALACALFYFQWFYLVPKFLRAIRGLRTQ